jgi:DNA-directed RNA polymerase specialized sigma24 family protein
LADQATVQRTSDSEDSRIADAIARLPMELRIPLVMYYFDGRTAKGIAEVLEISHSSACKRLRGA